MHSNIKMRFGSTSCKAVARRTHPKPPCVPVASTVLPAELPWTKMLPRAHCLHRSPSTTTPSTIQPGPVIASNEQDMSMQLWRASLQRASCTGPLWARKPPIPLVTGTGKIHTPLLQHTPRSLKHDCGPTVIRTGQYRRGAGGKERAVTTALGHHGWPATMTDMQHEHIRTHSIAHRAIRQGMH
jgi:hypothetical protein